MPSGSNPNIAVDTTLIIWGWGLLCGVVVVGLICLTVIVYPITRYHQGYLENLVDTVLKSNRALQLVTISALVMALLFLGVANRLNDGVLTLLGTVGGYVLGNLGRPEPESANDKAVSTE